MISISIFALIPFTNRIACVQQKIVEALHQIVVCPSAFFSSVSFLI